MAWRQNGAGTAIGSRSNTLTFTDNAGARTATLHIVDNSGNSGSTQSVTLNSTGLPSGIQATRQLC